MTQVDDSALIHSRPYDPAKAREYYLRTRELKGRKIGQKTVKVENLKNRNVQSTNKKTSPSKARREALEQQKASLEKRLDALKDQLEKLVEASKARSGINSEPQKAETSDTKNKTEEKPTTAKEKKDKAKKAKEAYVQENGPPESVPQEIQALQGQIKETRAKIQKALTDAREKLSKKSSSDKQTAPKGR